jgi:hypothetical protein
MLEAILVILVVIWLLGFFVMNLGTVVHILLVAAVVVLGLRLIKGKPGQA